MAMGFFLCLGYLTAGVEIFDFRFCGRANVVVKEKKLEKKQRKKQAMQDDEDADRAATFVLSFVARDVDGLPIGAEAVSFDVPVLIDDIIDLDSLTTETVIGYMFGGIAADQPNFGNNATHKRTPWQ